MQSLYVCANRACVHVTLRDHDAIAVTNTNDDTLLVRIDCFWLVVFGLVYIEADFFNESRRHDKEDEHDEHHVQHRCQIDLLVVFVFATRSEAFTHGMSSTFVSGGYVNVNHADFHRDEGHLRFSREESPKRLNKL